MKLTDRLWDSFYIGKLFVVKRPIARSEKNYSDGKIPFIASGNLKNGVIRCCTPNSNETLDKGNCITVSPVDGSAFYQPSSFLGRGGAGSSILLLYNEHLNYYVGNFIARLIYQTCSKYNYGKMGSQDSIKREKIMLPINDVGNPDYDFMEAYTKYQERTKQQEYLLYAKKMISKIDYQNIVDLNDKEWNEVFLTEIFDLIQRGKRLTKANQVSGIKPYVSSSAQNNGVDNHIGNTDRVREFYDCISLANSGSVGSSFYHEYKFVASDHVTHLKNEDFNKYIYLFIATLTGRLSDKYNFNREINDKRISREKILLPMSENGKPDYEYMEQYMKNIMYEKYSAYIDYLEKDTKK